MKQHVVDVSRDWISLVMTGLGISFAPHAFFGGLFLAFAAGSMIARHRRSNARLWAVMATSGVFATIAVIATQEWDHFGMEPQLVMASAGALSGWAVNIIVKMMDRVENRSSDIADKFVDQFFKGDGK